MADPKSFFLTEAVHTYLLDHSTPIDDVQRDLIATTEALGDISIMQIAPEQGTFMTMLARLTGATRAVEVGTFTGYSALCIARGLGPDSHLLCCDISEEWTALARRAWADAGIDDRIELRIAPALDTLRALPPEPSIDLAFIDADKESYVAYYEELIPRMRPGGLILVDNVLYFGLVADPTHPDATVEAIRGFNNHVRADPRVEVVMLSIGDGLTLARRVT